MIKEVVIASLLFVGTMYIFKEFTVGYANSISQQVYPSFEAKWVKAP